MQRNKLRARALKVKRRQGPILKVKRKLVPILKVAIVNKLQCNRKSHKLCLSQNGYGAAASAAAAAALLVWS